MKPPNKDRERENFDYYDTHRPEGKIELIDGRIHVGNSLDGSRLLLHHILRGWGADAAAALGSIEQWVSALREVYGSVESLDDNFRQTEWRPPDLVAGGEGPDGGHYHVRQHLSTSFFEVGEELGGQALGRIVMKLASNGFTPDSMFFKSTSLNTLHEYYLDGPAEMVIEVVRPSHRDRDVSAKREYYARGGVPEYLIVDPERRQVEILRLDGESYVRMHSDPSGFYRPSSIPGLAIQTEQLWPKDKYPGRRDEHMPFIVEQPRPSAERMDCHREGPGSDYLPFEPHLNLEPVPVLFEEYVAWSPEPKFEFWDGRIQLSGEEGVRNMTGLLLATLGLIETCRLAPPDEWMAALRSRRDMEIRQSEIRKDWRNLAGQAATLLHEKHKVDRIAVTGPLASTEPLTFWAQPELVVWGVSFERMQEIYKDLSAMNIDVHEGDSSWFEARLARGELKIADI